MDQLRRQKLKGGRRDGAQSKFAIWVRILETIFSSVKVDFINIHYSNKFLFNVFDAVSRVACFL